MGLTTNGKPVAFNGEGGVAMTINGIAVKEVEQSPVLPLVAVNPMATAPVTGTGGATVTFSNEGSGFFGQAPPASAAPATSLAFSSRNAAKPARLIFSQRRIPRLVWWI
jgi:hypothetical protein